MDTGIYAIINAVNGNQYIGSAVSIRKRWVRHCRELRGNCHANQHLQRAWHKYGEEAFSYVVLALCDREFLLTTEEKFIADVKPQYNICKSARNALGVKRSDETRRKMSLARKGWKPSEETRRRMSIAAIGKQKNKGKKWSAATKERNSGDNSPFSKLTLEAVREIRKWTESHQKTAQRYGISPSTVAAIRQGKIWREWEWS